MVPIVGEKTATKLGLVELVGFLHESQIYSWSEIVYNVSGCLSPQCHCECIGSE